MTVYHQPVTGPLREQKMRQSNSSCPQLSPKTDRPNFIGIINSIIIPLYTYTIQCHHHSIPCTADKLYLRTPLKLPTRTCIATKPPAITCTLPPSPIITLDEHTHPITPYFSYRPIRHQYQSNISYP